MAQHDPIVLAKQIATLDHLSQGRVVLGIGFGWNRDEAADHGVPFADRRAVAREHVQCMQALWSQERAEYHGTYVSLDPCWAWPKTVQQPRVPVLIGGGARPKLFDAIADYADGWMPVGGSGLAESLARLRAAFEARGRDPGTVRVVPFGTVPTQAKLEHYRDLGVDEVVLRVPSGIRRRDARRARCPCRLRRSDRSTMSEAWPDGNVQNHRRPWSGGGREDLADQVRRLINLTVTSAAPPAELAVAATALRELADRLEHHVPGPDATPTGRFAEQGLQADGAGGLAAAMPFDVVVGTCNPIAPPLTIEFEPPNAIAHGVFTSTYEGAPGCVHGAVLAGRLRHRADRRQRAGRHGRSHPDPLHPVSEAHPHRHPVPVRGLGDRAGGPSDPERRAPGPGGGGLRGGGGGVRQPRPPADRLHAPAGRGSRQLRRRAGGRRSGGRGWRPGHRIGGRLRGVTGARTGDVVRSRYVLNGNRAPGGTAGSIG